jgi:hypothetical protein
VAKIIPLGYSNTTYTSYIATRSGQVLGGGALAAIDDMLVA